LAKDVSRCTQDYLWLLAVEVLVLRVEDIIYSDGYIERILIQRDFVCVYFVDNQDRKLTITFPRPTKLVVDKDVVGYDLHRDSTRHLGMNNESVTEFFDADNRAVSIWYTITPIVEWEDENTNST
jgi:hypothetical protein